MTKDAALINIAELAETQEAAIRQHPPQTLRVFEKGRAALEEGHRLANPPDDAAAPFNREEMATINQLITTSSFMAAWYHLHGDKAHRDQAANSCSFVVASAGANPEDVLRRHIKLERLWRKSLAQEGVGTRWSWTGIVLLLGAVAAGFYFLFG